MVNAGLHEGVVNYITGPGGEIGRLLVQNKKIAGIVFTGSKEVGYELVRKTSEFKPRPVIAELGGKNAAIVTQTADLDRAAEGVVRGSVFIFRTKMQRVLSYICAKKHKIKIHLKTCKKN